MSRFAFLDTLEETIRVRADAGDASASYVAGLLKKGPTSIAKKVGEEGVEVALAAASGTPQALVAESADLLFHLLVLWQSAGVTPEDVAEELRRREGVSGLAEKAARKETP